MRPYREILKMALITEKGSHLQENSNQYMFETVLDANKHEIKRAVEQMFKVKVKKVRTMNMRGKIKTLGRFSGKRPNWKKAVVTLEQGHHIDLVEAV
ncbi:MAG: 50S ribosomal protein L23 [candidate division Zixibacteria bacterium]|nr:50S ribosomal protein L23 [candidate division Zixibacteria bacterium]